MSAVFLKQILRAGRSQLLGLSAQLIAATPIIAISIYLSRAVSLAAVADFALLVGISSVAFTVGMSGLRSWLVMDRFREFTEGNYYSLRIFATGPMALIILIAGPAFGAPISLTFAVVFLRIGDSALDLVMGIDQVRREDRAHMYGYLHGSIFKLAIILLAQGTAELTGWVDPILAFALAGAIYAVYAWNLALRLRLDRPIVHASGALSVIVRLLRHSAAFAMAQIVCAALISTPRIMLTALVDRDLAGAAGAALSVSTFCGMAFYAVWLRWAPRLGKDGLSPTNLAKFCTEMSLSLLAMLAVLWLIGERVMGRVFAITEPAHLELALSTLMASAVFLYVVGLANLFKATRLPWAESIVYVVGITSVLLLVIQEGVPQIPALLLAASAGMIAAEVTAAVVLRLLRNAEQLA